MKKALVVKKQEDFNRIIREGKWIKNKNFVIYYENNNLKYDCYGISVGKKIGKAVIRNKYKRRIRSLIDENKKHYQNNRNYIIILRKNALSLTYQELKLSFQELMEKQKENKNG